MKMKVLVDADGCPVVGETIEIAKQHNLSIILICDTAHEMHRDGAETITVSKGADAVDFVLVNKVKPFDIVVTQDYGLAAMVLAKKAFAIDQNGREYTVDNIDALLHARHTAKKIRMSGGRLKGPKKRSKDANRAFQDELRKLLQKAAARNLYET
ncbi:YaiI/YqxD family protein [Paenisporosarcina cavernae]|uniref:UPF0178 protein D3873_01580 n=1 Tax=Paenisporosarcina cavernae TaxID=2320858 RepID=A0A385YSJ3_9BACL|nr:YaiI/YqxD family protein [Paenisporosarcina cavernae]AYC28622.1 YaiI/YqxD family protein [Paenisporosarcina cavernae]